MGFAPSRANSLFSIRAITFVRCAESSDMLGGLGLPGQFRTTLFAMGVLFGGTTTLLNSGIKVTCTECGGSWRTTRKVVNHHDLADVVRFAGQHTLECSSNAARRTSVIA